MVCVGAAKGSGPAADQGRNESDEPSGGLCEFAAAGSPTGSRCSTTIRWDPGRFRNSPQTFSTPSWLRSARMPTTRSALSACAGCSCAGVCSGMESTSNVQSFIVSARSIFRPVIQLRLRSFLSGSLGCDFVPNSLDAYSSWPADLFALRISGGAPLLKLQPKETIGRQGKPVRLPLDGGEFHVAEHLHRNHTLKCCEI